MAVKLKLPPNRSIAEKPLWETVLIFVCIVFTFTLLILGITFSYYSNKYKQVVDERLAKPLFNQTPRIYAAPREVRIGQKLTAASIAQQLRTAGYTAARQQRLADGHLRAARRQHQPCIPARSPTTRRKARPSPSTTAWSPASPAMPGSSSPPMNSSRSSSPASPRARTAPSAASSPTTSCRPRWSRPSPPSRTAASSPMAASTTISPARLDLPRSARRSPLPWRRLHAHHAACARHLPLAGAPHQAQAHRSRHHLPA